MINLDETLYRFGDKAAAMYIVAKGECRAEIEVETKIKEKKDSKAIESKKKKEKMMINEASSKRRITAATATGVAGGEQSSMNTKTTAEYNNTATATTETAAAAVINNNKEIVSLGRIAPNSVLGKLNTI